MASGQRLVRALQLAPERGARATRCRGSAPFTNGAKIGHCVELEQGSATVNGTLRSGADLRLDNATNTISQGDTDARVAQIQWLLQSSYRAAAVNGPNFQNGVEPGAHQSAIWKITNPNDAANDIGTGTALRAHAADALADQLLAAAQANSGALDQSTWSLSIQGGNGPSLHGHARAPSRSRAARTRSPR